MVLEEKESNTKFSLNSGNPALDELFKRTFPKGKIEIDKGAEEVLILLNNKVDKNTAGQIFIRAATRMELEIIKPDESNNKFTDLDLKQSLKIQFPDLEINIEQCKKLHGYLTLRILSRSIGGDLPHSTANGDYVF